VRDRVLYNLVFFALLMMAAAVAVGQISIGIEQTVIVSLGLSANFSDRVANFSFPSASRWYPRKWTSARLRAAGQAGAAMGIPARKIAGLVLTLAVNTARDGAGLLLVMIYVKHALERSDAVVLVAVYFILLEAGV